MPTTLGGAAAAAAGGGLSSSPVSRPAITIRSSPSAATAGGGGVVRRASSRRAGVGSGADTTEDEYDEADGEEEDEDGEEEQMEAEAGEQLRNETSIKSGYLYKRGEKRKNWKKRWFVLRSSKLCYYKNDKEYQLLRFIDINDVHTVASIELKRINHSFGIVTSSRQYYVRASSKEDKEAWITALNEVKENLRQRSTLTREIAVEDLMGSARTQQGGSPVLAATPGASGVVSVHIPGQGQYNAPAQPRAIPGSSAFSPLTATSASGGSVSDGEHVLAAAGAEKFGLSFASQSSMSQSRLKDPSLHAARSPSPHSHSGGEHSQGEGVAAGVTRHRSLARPAGGAAAAGREASAGSSGGEGRNTTTGWTLNPATAPGGDAGAAAVLSSSDEEDGAGDDWDEDEVADQAMPLPGPGIVHLSTSAAAAQASSMPVAAQQAPSATPQRSDAELTTTEFLKDPNKVINQGYLMKQSSRRKTWRKRWFVLTSSKLMYTRSHMDSKPNRQIPLSSILDAIEYTSKKSGGLTLPSLGVGSSPAAAGAQSPGIHSPAGFGQAFGEPSTPVVAVVERREGQASGTGSGFSSAGDREGAVAAGTTDPAILLSPAVGAPAGAATSSTSVASSNLPTSLAGMSINSVTPTTPIAPSTPALGGHASPSGPTLSPGSSVGSQKRKKENCFKIITPKRTYVVCAPTEEEEIKWLSALQALLTRTRGQSKSAAAGVTAAAAAAVAPATPSLASKALRASESPAAAAAPLSSTSINEGAPSSGIATTTLEKPRQRVHSNVSTGSAS